MIGWGYHYLTHLGIDNISALSTENEIIVKDLNDGMMFKVQWLCFFKTAATESFLSELLHSHNKLFALTSKYFVA